MELVVREWVPQGTGLSIFPDVGCVERVANDVEDERDLKDGNHIRVHDVWFLLLWLLCVREKSCLSC